MRIKTKIFTAFAFMFTLTMTACVATPGESASVESSVETSVGASIVGVSVGSSVGSSVGVSAGVSAGDSMEDSVRTSEVVVSNWTAEEQAAMITYGGEVLPYMTEFGTDYYFEAAMDEDGGFCYIAVEGKGNNFAAYKQKVANTGFVFDSEGSDTDDDGDDYEYAFYYKEKDATTDYYLDLYYYVELDLFEIIIYPLAAKNE